jgi:hypothetical protein
MLHKWWGEDEPTDGPGDRGQSVYQERRSLFRFFRFGRSRPDAEPIPIDRTTWHAALPTGTCCENPKLCRRPECWTTVQGDSLEERDRGDDPWRRW